MSEEPWEDDFAPAKPAADEDDFSSFGLPAGDSGGAASSAPVSAALDDDDDEFSEFGVPAAPPAMSSLPSLDDDDEFAEFAVSATPSQPSEPSMGTCANGECYCHPGYAGDACETSLLCPANCSSHGVCRNSKCY